MHWDFALILITLGIVVPLIGRRRIRLLLQMPDTTKVDRLSLYASTIAFQWLAVGVVLWRANVHGIHLSALGFSVGEAVLTITITVVITILLLLNQLLSIKKIASIPSELGGAVVQVALKIFPRDSVERLAFFALVATVAVCEEALYRGFAQFVFDRRTGSTFIGIVASAALFALAHLYQGRRGLVSTFVVGVLFAGVRAWTGSLIPSIVAHFAADLTVGYLAPSRIRKAMEAARNLQPDEASFTRAPL